MCLAIPASPQVMQGEVGGPSAKANMNVHPFWGGGRDGGKGRVGKLIFKRG